MLLIGERKKKMFSKFFKAQQFQGKKRRDFIHIEKSKFCCLVAKIKGRNKSMGKLFELT